MFKVKVKGKEYQFTEKILLKELSKKLGIESYVATVNNRLRELNYYINYDCEVEFLDLNHFDAARVYETSMRYIIIMALERLYPGVKVRFSQSVSRSLACYLDDVNVKIDSDFIFILENEIKKIVEADYLIERKKLAKDEAIEVYNTKGYYDKNEVIRYRIEDTVNVYQCQDYINYMFGYMVPSTGYLKDFVIKLYHPSFIVQFPRFELGGAIPEFVDSPSFGRMIRQSREWAKMAHADTIAHLNKHIENNTIVDLVEMCEMRHNNMLADLGLRIKDDIENIRLIAIAGPSSSGKTTFSKRLRIELMTRDIKPVMISIDDYYLGKNEAPLDENGEYDLEHIEALDIELFNKHLLALVQGEEVIIPRFDFKNGIRKSGYKLQIDEDTPIIIEGIHALNERLTALIPKQNKFKIYISPAAQVNIDNHNPINATEIRMLRRIVRDAKFRKTSPSITFSMWSSVRRGEFTWIYPYQEQADYIFNSALTYELSVMKKYALPVLENIDRNDQFFIAANRLVKFLKYFLDIDDAYVPSNSLLREFIGGSSFYRK